MTAHNLDREVVKALQQPQWKAAQCEPPRHFFDVKDGHIVGDCCRCGTMPIKRMVDHAADDFPVPEEMKHERQSSYT